MAYLILKAILTGAIIVAVSEIARRSSFFAAILASLPLTSILAMIWMHLDGSRIEEIVNLSKGIFWMVLPSLFFFAAFPTLVRLGLRFYPALLGACVLMAGVYWGYGATLRRLGIGI